MVIFAVGTAYLRVITSAAKVETTRAQLTSAQELNQQIANQVRSEVAPEIDSLRAQVEEQTAEQRRKRPKLAADSLFLREGAQECMCPLVFVVDT